MPDNPIHLDVAQGTAEWIEARLGIPTTSEFKRILTPKGALSASRKRYLGELLAEYCLGHQVTEFQGNEWMERGKALEPQARSAYAIARDSEARSCGIFFSDDDRLIGASPDFMVGDNGIGELKCPTAGVHCMYLAEDRVPPEYWMQVQGQLWVTGRSWCDFVSYHPDLPPLIVRATPDAALHNAMREAMIDFLDELLAGRERLRNMGAALALEDRRPIEAPRDELDDLIRGAAADSHAIARASTA